MKKILIIGAGFLQSFVIKKARDIGYYTFAIDLNPNSIGFKYADEFSIIDIVDIEKCLNYAKSKNIDGVMTAATDYGVLSAAYIANKLGLPGLDYNIAKKIKDKYKVREILAENKIDGIEQYFEVCNIQDLDRIKNSIKFPVLVKPCDGSGSKAVSKVDNFLDLVDACKKAINASLVGKAFIEDFIYGKEYGIESFVYKGKIYIFDIMKKYMTDHPDYAELGHSLSSSLNINRYIRKIIKRTLKALKINFGAVNIDVLIDNNKDIYIVDIGARMGGNLIGSHIIPLGTGIDYLGNLIKAAVGDPLDLKPKEVPINVASRILALTPGKIIKLPDFGDMKKKLKVDIYHHINIGDTIREYHNNLDGCGYVLAIADSIEKAEERVEKAKRFIDSSIVRQ